MLSSDFFVMSLYNGGILSLSDQVLAALRKKHPPPADLHPTSLFFGPIANLRDIRFKFDEQRILAVARSLGGFAGHSGLNANQFISVLCSNQFKGEGK